MVDAAEGVIGIEWIEGKSVRSLLPGGAEEEIDEAEDGLDEEDADPLLAYGTSQGTLDLSLDPTICLFPSRKFDESYWNGNCQDAHSGHYPR